MKKNLFYAAFALAMMASCTNEDSLVTDQVEPTPEDKVAIELGIDAPSVNATVGSRGSGSVGDVAGESNKWNDQQLYIKMIDREDFSEAKDGENILMNSTYEYRAPRSTDDQTTDATSSSTTGSIRIYAKYPGTSDENKEKGLLQYLYYPVTGTYDFYGWHTDDATDGEGTVNIAEKKITVSDITIDGTQDIMAAKTRESSKDIYTDWTEASASWMFSAKSARNGWHPILKFEHQLARVKFFVKAGSYSAALHDENGDKRTEQTEDAMSTGAMYVTGIRMLDMYSGLTMVLSESGIETSKGEGEATTFSLMDKGSESLTAVAPNYKKDYSVPEGETDYAQVGDAIMYLPVSGSTDESISFEVDLAQYLKVTEDETKGDFITSEPYSTWELKKSEKNKLTVKAAHLTNSNGVDKFMAGYSYNVYITIYGFEKIEVSAELTPWEMGGDVDVDIENGESQGNADSGDEGE